MRAAGRSEAVEMYLKSLAVLGGGERPVGAAAVADRLRVSPAAVSEMLRRLARDGLVSHLPQRGFALTEAGRAAAWDVLRRERLWERFLVDSLGLDLASANDWACSLEHATAPEVVEALDDFLGRPEACPMGQPIPRSAHDPVRRSGRPLDQVEPGETVRLVAFDDETAEVIAYLQGMGLAPGATVTVAGVGPRRSLIEIDGPSGRVAIGREIAATVQTADPGAPAA